jgi:periplasmic protein TonB
VKGFASIVFSIVLAAFQLSMIKKDGTVEVLRVVRPLGLGLDEKAVEAIKQWKFKPGTRSGQAVDVVLNIEINFILR